MKNKHVGLREFQQRLHANLPEEDEQVTITRYGEPSYYVFNAGTLDPSTLTTSTVDPLLTPKEKAVEKVRQKVRTHRIDNGFCMCHECVERDVESTIMWNNLDKAIPKIAEEVKKEIENTD